MINVKDANAMAEVLFYLKGIKQDDINKIPKKLIQYLNENALKDYKCNFDYRKPLKELNLSDETRGIIGMICYNYWCVTKEQKEQYLKRLNQNEQQYQKIIQEKYNPENLFKNNKIKDSSEEVEKLPTIESQKIKWYKKIFAKILDIFRKK